LQTGITTVINGSVEVGKAKPRSREYAIASVDFENEPFGGARREIILFLLTRGNLPVNSLSFFLLLDPYGNKEDAKKISFLKTLEINRSLFPRREAFSELID
jgi:hypothetical protein